MPSCIDNDIEKVKEFFDETLKVSRRSLRSEPGSPSPSLADESRGDHGQGELGLSAVLNLPLTPKLQQLLDEAEIEVGSDDEMFDEGSPGATTSPVKRSKIKSDDSDSDSKPVKRKSRRKVLPASYEPDKRADSWLKVKKDYLEDLGDSLDLIPIGAWHGSGRKAAWWSPILLGCYDQESGTIQPVCKCMSGFTDDRYKEITTKYAVDGPNTTRACPAEIDGASESEVSACRVLVAYALNRLVQTSGLPFGSCLKKFGRSAAPSESSRASPPLLGLR